MRSVVYASFGIGLLLRGDRGSGPKQMKRILTLPRQPDLLRHLGAQTDV